MLPPDQLGAYPCFADLDPDQLMELAKASEWREYAVSDLVFKESDSADHLFVVVEGEVDIFATDAAGKERVVDAQVKGNLMLLSALVPPHEAQFGGRAKKPTKLIAIDSAVLRRLMADRPDVGFRVMNYVAKAMGSRLVGARYQLAAER